VRHINWYQWLHWGWLDSYKREWSFPSEMSHTTYKFPVEEDAPLMTRRDSAAPGESPAGESLGTSSAVILPK